MSAKIHVEGRFPELNMPKSWHFPTLTYPSTGSVGLVASEGGDPSFPEADLFSILERKGLITRSRPAEGQRPVTVALTPRGKVVLRHLLTRLHELHDEEARLFAGKERDDLVYRPTTINGELDASKPASRFICPLCQSSLDRRFREA
jgi:hypothetical protein